MTALVNKNPIFGESGLRIYLALRAIMGTLSIAAIFSGFYHSFVKFLI
jgi:hypothetical protein